MRSLLVGALMLASACSEVRLVDDDGAGGNDGGGAGLGGGGDVPSPEPAQARLITKWHGTPEVHGFQLWNEPDETGIDREPDAHVQISGFVRGLALLGDSLVVYDNLGDLHLFDDAWSLTSGATATIVVDLQAPVASNVSLRTIPELDWLSVPPLIVRNASALASAATSQEVAWSDPVYDVERDRLFVLQDGAVRVIDDVSVSDSLEPSWTLHAADEDEPFRNLISDGQTLFASGNIDPNGFGVDQVLVWPLDVSGPSAPGDLDANASGMAALAPIPGAGVVGITAGAIWAWDDASPASQTNSGWDVEEGALWQAVVVSLAHRFYACGEGVWVYADPTLGEPLEIAPVEGDGILLLIEREP
jgi:hypothetical protein